LIVFDAHLIYVEVASCFGWAVKKIAAAFAAAIFLDDVVAFWNPSGLDCRRRDEAEGISLGLHQANYERCIIHFQKPSSACPRSTATVGGTDEIGTGEF